MNFIYGVIGMVLVLLVFAAGVAVGWKVKEKIEANKAKTVEKALNEKERQQLVEDQQAFRTMIGYNVDMAYGTDLPPDAPMEV